MNSLWSITSKLKRYEMVIICEQYSCSSLCTSYFTWICGDHQTACKTNSKDIEMLVFHHRAVLKSLKMKYKTNWEFRISYIMIWMLYIKHLLEEAETNIQIHICRWNHLRKIIKFWYWSRPSLNKYSSFQQQLKLRLTVENEH